MQYSESCSILSLVEGRIAARNAAILGLVLLAVALGFIYGLYGLGGSEVQAQEDCRDLDTIGPETTDQRLGPF